MKKEKAIKIKYYNALVNKENATLGFVVDTKEQDLKFFKNKDLKYTVDPDNMIVYVYSDKHCISFGSLTRELIYYAFKTCNLIIFVGTKDKGINYKYIYEALLD